MKKHLFLIASVFATVSLQAQVIVNVAADTGVKIKESTLFYVDGQMKVADYSGVGNKKISNQGNVKITEKLVNENVNAQGQEDGSNFVNESKGTGKYGQLIINSDKLKLNTGKISAEIRFNSGFNFQTVAIPYNSLTAEDIVKEAFKKGESDNVKSAFIAYTGGGAYQENRYKNPLFCWDNKDYVLDNLSADNKIVPGKAYGISQYNETLGVFDTGKNIILSGEPHKDEFTVEVFGYVPGPYNKSVNKYGEAYGSYIVDFTITDAPDGWGDFALPGAPKRNSNNYGANIFNLGNPYTSNIDLSKGEGFLGTTIYQFDTNTYVTDLETAAVASYPVQNALTPQGAGDPLLSVRPFQTFQVKVNNLNKGSKHKFKFKNEMKTFNIDDSKAVNVLFNKSGRSVPEINQIGLDLYDDKGFTGVKTYVVASDVYEAAQQGEGTEVYNNMGDESTGIYTLQENGDGTVNEKLSGGKTYINGINADKYIAKPIYLVFQNGKGQYTLKARLNESLENNKNAFYFEDKETGKVQKIGRDFEYTFDVNGTEKDRFVLYWAATPNKEKVEEVAKQEINTTVVFKDVDTYKVRFDKGIKTADVFVYSISGQLVDAAKNIDTSVDYIVPLKGNSSVYIIKVVGDSGQVTTKKVLK